MAIFSQTDILISTDVDSLETPRYCTVVPLTVQSTWLRFSSAGRALSLPGLIMCRPTLAKMPGILSELPAVQVAKV